MRLTKIKIAFLHLVSQIVFDIVNVSILARLFFQDWLDIEVLI